MKPEIARDLASMMDEGDLTANPDYSGRAMMGELTGAVSGAPSAMICAAAKLGAMIERESARGRRREYYAEDLTEALANLRTDAFGYDTIWY